ncbi:MAG: type VI secretion system-associated FHA domain protein TagH [Gammaproteobacteria bacterium]
MSIEITIIKSPAHLQNTDPCRIFTEQGGTIGRGADNAWVVEDPEKFISSVHSQIVFENGVYYLVDLSTNGTFLNGASEPVGHGNRLPLKDGDRFTLGDYEFLVSMQGGGQASAGDPFGAGQFSGMGSNPDSGLDAIVGGGGGRHDDPFALGTKAFDTSLTPLLTPGFVETDPLQALDKATGRNAPFFDRAGGSQGDDADPMQHAVTWPKALPDDKFAIPEDWYKDEGPADTAQPPPAAPDPQLVQQLREWQQRCKQLESERRKLLAHINTLTERLKNAPAAAPSPARPMAVDAALIEAMGLSKWEISAQKKAEISQIVGALIRETIEGLMQALTFRKRIKEEFRINVTTIQPVENNPLKFSANLDDALENMFVKSNKAYQGPLDAVREGFHSISEHQLAVLAGIQAAFRGMIERLDPEALEQRFEKYRKGGVLKVGHKAKNWDSYKEFHKDLVNDLENSFQHLFGYDFVQAYEEQLQRLVVARKARTKSSAKK